MEKTIENLWQFCHKEIEECEKKILRIGDDYNIFSILGHTSKELTHSKLIASLLDPNGSHHMGPVFLDAFIDVVGIDKCRFDGAHSSVKTEKPLGIISNDPMNPDGGRIDIILTDRNGQNIIIENKIFADDQKKQLIRYNQHRSEGIPILYLTPTGRKPKEYSYKTDGIALSEGKDFKCISYKEHIIKWLEACLKSTLPENVKTVIHQYLNIVKKIVNKTSRDEMRDGIVKYITENGYLDTAFEINSLIEDIQIKAQTAFWKEIEEKLKELKPEFTLDFSGKSSDETIEDCVRKYITKGECRYFGYDVKIGSYEGKDVYLKLCTKENLLLYVHFREPEKHVDEFRDNLKHGDASGAWESVKDELRVMWRYPNDKKYKMIDFGKTLRPSQYDIDGIVCDFIKAKDQLSELCTNTERE